MELTPSLYAVLVIVSQFFHFTLAMTCRNYKLDLQKNIHVKKRLTNHIVLNLTISHPIQCFNKCSQNCLCESFNVCEEGKKCELCSSTKEASTAEYVDDDDCAYYSMERETAVQSGGSTSAPCGTTCCYHGNPCYNEGECIGSCPDTGKRFVCRCRPGFQGDRCERQPMTCLDYWTTTKPSNGGYDLYDENGGIYTAYCDFNSEAGFAWTLVMSRSRETTMAALIVDSAARFLDSPKTAVHWREYRLARSTMAHVSERSTHWRFTCEYDTRGVADYVDYARGKIADTDIVNYDGRKDSSRCRAVEFVNVRGKQCQGCTFGLQQAGLILHSTESFGSRYGCDLKLDEFKTDCPSHAEFYFGALHTRSGACISGKHRCSATADSTGQIWLGGKKMN